MSTKTIETNSQYTISQSGDNSELSLNWAHVEGLSISDFKQGIAKFSVQCETNKPSRAVIDARSVDHQSPAFAWLSGQEKFEDQEEYMSWWMREVVPNYNDAKITSLAVATGNPQAPGELNEVAPEIHFKMGYFNSLEDARNWEV